MEQNLFEIVFDRPVVQCNDFLSGNFDINSRVADIHSVKFQFWEKSRCEWTKYKGFLFNKSKTYTGSKDTLHIETLLTFCEELNSIKRYYFRVKIPHNLPSTWEGLRGYIGYFIKILVDFQGQQKTFESEVFVKPYRDLKLERHLLHETRQDVNHSFSFTILNLGYVEISMWLPVSGVARGQSLPVLCTVNNQSSSIFTVITFVLKLNEIYVSTSPSVNKQVDSFELLIVKQNTTISFGIYEYYCLLKTKKDWHPTTQCPKGACCEITYDLKVKITALTQDNLDQVAVETKSVPIIIGTEPILEWNAERITNELTKESLNRKWQPGDNRKVYNFESENEICTKSTVIT